MRLSLIRCRLFSFQPDLHSNIQFFIENKSPYLQLLCTQASQKADAKSCQEQKLISVFNDYGSRRKQETFSNRSDSVTIQQMLQFNMHLGHSLSKYHPKMRPFIYGEREGICIFDLEITLYYLRKAVAAAKEIAAAGGNVLFVGERRGIERLVYESAINCGHFYINGPWTQGLVRNREFLLGSERYMPDLIIVFDHATNSVPVTEANRQLIPTIAICDSDSDPTNVTYPIPANDDSYESVDLIAKMLEIAVKEGTEMAQAKKCKE